MRTGLWIAMGLLAAVITAGVISEGGMEALSQRYVSAAEELRVLTEKEAWAQAEQAVGAYMADWQARVGTLQMLINHDDVDDVTLSLRTLAAAIAAQDRAACLMACAGLREHALHLHHRDAFTLANVL